MENQSHGMDIKVRDFYLYLSALFELFTMKHETFL